VPSSHKPARGFCLMKTMNLWHIQSQPSATYSFCSMWSCLTGGLSTHSRGSATLCQVSDESERVSKLSSASGTDAVPDVVD